MLLGGRVDAVMANNCVMRELLNKFDAMDKVKIYLNKEKPLSVYFSKSFINRYPEFIERFNSTVLDIKE